MVARLKLGILHPKPIEKTYTPKTRLSAARGPVQTLKIDLTERSCTNQAADMSVLRSHVMGGRHLDQS